MAQEQKYNKGYIKDSILPFFFFTFKEPVKFWHLYWIYTLLRVWQA